MSPFRSRSVARCRSCASSGFSTLWSTSVAKIGDKGQPWLTPSFIDSSFHFLFFHLYLTVPWSSYRRDVRGSNSGKSLLMMSNSSSRETALNMLVRSTKIAALDGVSWRCCGCSMNFSMDSCIVLMMKSMPFGIPTA